MWFLLGSDHGDARLRNRADLRDNAGFMHCHDTIKEARMKANAMAKKRVKASITEMKKARGLKAIARALADHSHKALPKSW